VHPNIHVQFGAAVPNLHRAGLEYMPPGSGLDGLDELLQSSLEVHDGNALVPDRPGLGLDWDWNAVTRFADVR
jgi:L-alanine-DL-glutamate epimerase-like enolase superfamily enzyme